MNSETNPMNIFLDVCIAFHVLRKKQQQKSLVFIFRSPLVPKILKIKKHKTDGENSIEVNIHIHIAFVQICIGHITIFQNKQ